MNFHGGAQHSPFYSRAGHSAPPPSRGPPPTKKPRSNPIITRYPPPPGYRPPVLPASSYQHSGWQHSAPISDFTSPSNVNYQSLPYSQASPYQAPQTQYQGYPPQPYSGNDYPLPQNGYAFGAQSGWQGPIAAPQSAPPVSHHSPPYQFNQKPRRHNSAPFASYDYGSGSVDGNDDPFPPQDAASLAAEDLDDDYDGECYFARHPEHINPDLSLGLIEWKAPLPTKLALPSTFADAELEALAPRVLKPTDDESISEYFVNSRRDESLNSVRLSDSWHEIKDCIIFKEFPAVCRETLSLYELISMYKDRFDPIWAADESASSTPELSRESTPALRRPSSQSMDVDPPRASFERKRSTADSDLRILDDLEQALGSPNDSLQPANRKKLHSRSASATSQHLPRLKKPKPLPPLRDQAQENILAALGVTGSPKLVYETPGPAFGPPPELRSGSNSRANSVSSNHSGIYSEARHQPQHSLKRDRSPSWDLWRSGHQENFGPPKRPISAGSQHTAAGSDFQPDDNDATPRAKPQSHDVRKRGHVDSEDEDAEMHYQDDNITPKQRKKQPRIGDASK